MTPVTEARNRFSPGMRARRKVGNVPAHHMATNIHVPMRSRSCFLDARSRVAGLVHGIPPWRVSGQAYVYPPDAGSGDCRNPAVAP